MGSLLCCAGSAVCCTVSSLGSCCCRAASAGSSGKGNGPSTKVAKVFYLLLIVVSAVTALLLRAYGGHLFVKLYSFHFGCVGEVADRCFGTQAVFRVSFAVTVFFGIVLLLSLASSDLFRAYWGPKLFLWAALVVASFFIPNQFFNVYADIARVVGALFLLLVVVILIDFAYTLQEWIEDKASAYEDSLRDEYEEIGICQNWWRILYMVCVGIMLLGSFIAIVIMYKFSTPNNCGGNIGLLSVTLLLGLILTVMSVLQVFGGRGLMCPAVVFTYATWLMWSAMSSNPTKGGLCNPLSGNDDSPWAILVGCLVSGFSLAYTSYSAASSAPKLFGKGDSDDDSRSGLLDNDVETGTGATDDGDEEEAAAVAVDEDDSDDEEGRSQAASSSTSGSKRENNWFFVVIMLTASLYMAMLLSNWGTGQTTGVSATSRASFWVKIASQWLTFLMYGWTLIAPAICSNRDF